MKVFEIHETKVIVYLTSYLDTSATNIFKVYMCNREKADDMKHRGKTRTLSLFN